jgi:hypothetical protein
VRDREFDDGDADAFHFRLSSQRPPIRILSALLLFGECLFHLIFAFVYRFYVFESLISHDANSLKVGL